MPRAVPEWIATHDDQAIPPRVKARIVERQGGKCACCVRKLGMAGECIEFDHVLAIINGGQHREANLQAICGLCHVPKTKADMAIKKKNERVKKKRYGFETPKRKMPYRRFNGEIVYPEN